METAIILKDKESAGIGEDDRISNLPDDILRHILSFLPTLDSVRTTFLSKTWNKNKLWISVPTVDLDFQNYRSSKVPFIMFVDHVFSSRGASDILKFRLRFNLVEKKEWSHVENWICTAIRCNVVELDLTLTSFVSHTSYSEQVDFTMPESVFTSKTLLVLKVLSNCISYSSPTVTSGFSALKAQNLFSNSIEDLTIEGNRYGNMKLNISAPRMKKLKIEIPGRRVFINAPKLEVLEVFVREGRAGGIYFVESPRSLQVAKVTPGVYSIRSTINAEPCFSHVFDMLNKLEIEVNLFNINLSSKWLTELLNQAPNLECLAISFRGTRSSSKVFFDPPESVPICLSTKLKDISIMARYVFDPVIDDVMRMAGYLGRWLLFCQEKDGPDFIVCKGFKEYL